MSSERPVELEVLMDGDPLSSSQAHQDVSFRDGRVYLTVDRDDMYYIIKTRSVREARSLPSSALIR